MWATPFIVAESCGDSALCQVNVQRCAQCFWPLRLARMFFPFVIPDLLKHYDRDSFVKFGTSPICLRATTFVKQGSAVWQKTFFSALLEAAAPRYYIRTRYDTTAASGKCTPHILRIAIHACLAALHNGSRMVTQLRTLGMEATRAFRILDAEAAFQSY